MKALLHILVALALSLQLCMAGKAICDDGEITGNPNNCSSYFECCNGQYQEIFCEAGYYFEIESKKCLEDVNNICGRHCQEGDISANDKCCSSYYVCCKGELVEEICDTGYYFDLQTKRCEKDVDHTCWPLCHDGEIFPSNNSCASYYICCNGTLKEEFCQNGYYFNASCNKCEEDIENVCCSKCQEGEISANDNSCSSYYVCQNGQMKEEFCKVGFYFNSQTKQCEEDLHNNCWPICQDGDVKPSESCSVYFNCSHGAWEIEFCPEGYYFDHQMERCERDLNHSCWPQCQEGEMTGNQQNCSAYYICSEGSLLEKFCNVGFYFNNQTKKCEIDTHHNCWPLCVEGDSSESDSCSSYLICRNGAWQEEFCKEGYYYNGQTKQCEKDNNNICWSQCHEGEFAVGNSCSSYLNCSNGSWKEEFCAVGHYFSFESKTCIYDLNNICWDRCKDGSILANENSCSSYYNCTNGLWNQEFCNGGYYFNSQSEQCEPDVNKICWSRCPEGGISAISCASYYICSNGTWIKDSCNEGYLFNAQINRCEPDVNNICWDQCHEGELKPNKNSCSSYYSCSNGYWKEEFCSEGYYFDAENDKCEKDVNHSCWPQCSEGEMTENSNSCSAYYVCKNGDLVEQYCKVGYYFDAKTKQCKYDTNHECWPTCTEGEISENDSCSSYLICANGEWKEEFCKPGYYFNLQNMKCQEDIDNSCWTHCQNGDTSASNSCSSYLTCSNGYWKEEFCSEGYYFDSENKQCDKDVNHTCWPQCSEGEMTANSNSCSSYYVCKNGDLVEQYCKVGYYFDAKTKQCKYDTNHECWPTCTEGEISENDSCSSYHICANGEWKEEFCKPGYYFNLQNMKCQEDIDNTCWTDCQNGDTLASNSCSSYLTCSNGYWKEEFCSEGYYFDAENNKCEKDVNHTCWPQCSEGEMQANSKACSSYYICKNGDFVEQYCKVGYYFDAQKKQCEYDTNHECWPSCTEGDITENDSCSSYLICENGGWKEEFCKPGYYFNLQNMKCQEDIDNSCWTHCQNGDTSASNSCSSYLTCSNGYWKEEFCSEGYYFDSENKQCDKDVNHTCWPQCSEGEMTANSNSCSSYYVCKNGDLVEQYCKVGYYFDAKTKQCEYDTNHECWPSCTEGDITENDSCSSYLICENGGWKEEFCKPGYYFNLQNMKCQEDIDNSCWTHCQNGDTSASNSCSSYLACSNGYWKEEFCSEGYYFDAENNKCEKDVNHTCWPQCSEGEMQANGNACSSYYICKNGNMEENYCKVGYYFDSQTKQCEYDTNHECWPSCTEGDITENDSCSSYLICENGGWKEEFCKPGYYFNLQNMKCQEDIDNSCWTHCQNGDTTASNSCSSYLTCSNGYWKEEYCSEGYYFDSENKQCDKDVNHTCWPQCSDGEMQANINACSSYYICKNGDFVEQYCKVGYYFNSQKKQCEYDTNHECWPTCKDDDISENDSCSSYLICANGEWKEEFCKPGYYFNLQNMKCQEDIDNSCWTHCQNGDTSAGNSCSSYLTCSNGYWKEEYCSEGYYFNSANYQCEKDANHTCWPQCSEGDMQVNINSCSSYYVCKNGNLEEDHCKVGYYFDSQTKQCEYDTNHECWPICTEGEISENDSCSSYLICANGEWKEEFCNPGYYFNLQNMKCQEDIDNTCRPQCQNGDASAGNSCSSYLTCSNGYWKEEYCIEGYYFVSANKQCEKDVNHTCWPQCSEGEMTANSNSCSSYYVCKNGNLEEDSCKVGYYFDSQTKLCEYDTNHVCWPTCKDGDITENDSCSSYLICANGEWKEEFCITGYYFNSQNKSCEEDINHTCWSLCNNGEISSSDSCSSFLQCQNGVWKQIYCSEGYFFDSQSKKCEEDVEGICWTPVPPPPATCDPLCCNQPNGKPILGDTCQQFIVCDSGKPNVFNCPNNLHFNVMTGFCDFPQNANCDKPYTPPSGPNAGPSGTYCATNGRCLGQHDGTFLLDSESSCSGKYVVCQCECEVERSCSPPLMFNSKLGVCDWPDNFGC
ncbi:uncharacterized protein LOC142234790 [Haematobia irritans]|uniref:uncharacterized protein LOC142234790 n=1 Tax=Haematobia irritans TaxID=7368 RepID=UPI003F50C762